MAEHRSPEKRFPGLATEAVCENGHKAIVADRGFPFRGACTMCQDEHNQRAAMWYEAEDA